MARRPCTLALLVAALLAAGCGRDTRAARGAAGGAPAGVSSPASLAPSGAGLPELVDARSLQALLEGLHGKVAVVNVWASWCAPLLAELPEVDAFARAARGRGVVVLSLSVDELPSRETTVKTLLATLKPSFRVLQKSGPGDPVRAVLDERWEGVLPTTFVLDRSGVVRATLIGPQKRSGFEAAVNALLADRGPAEIPAARGAQAR